MKDSLQPGLTYEFKFKVPENKTVPLRSFFERVLQDELRIKYPQLKISVNG